MKELKEKISYLINEYFDKKIEHVDWRYDCVAEDKANKLIKECVEEVLYELDGFERDMDNHLEEFEAMYAPEEHPTDYEFDYCQRLQDLISERR